MNKKNIPDGFEMSEVVRDYTEAILPLIRVFPLLGTSRGAGVIAVKRNIGGSFAELASILKEVVYTFLRHEKPDIDMFRSDILIASSSEKPGWGGAMSELRKRMAKRGVSCIRLQGKNIEKEFLGQEVKWQSIEGLLRFTPCRVGSALSLVKALFYTLLLAVYLPFRDFALFRKFFTRPLALFSHFYGCSKRMLCADYLLGKIKPKVLITNGDHVPLLSELMFSRKIHSIHRIWLFNENTSKGFMPVTADEMWVWNETMANYWRNNITSGSKTKISVTGRAEIDEAVTPNACREKDALKNCNLSSENIILFLSQYLPNFPFDLKSPSEEAVSWLCEAVKMVPEWGGVYKSRPVRDDGDAPGLQDARELPNFTVADSAIPLETFLNWDKVKAVCALHSTGLFVAAGLGKVAIRLCVSKKVTKDPVIDEVSIHVHSPEELADVLKNIASGKIEPISSEKEKKLFPYRGKVMERMESLTLERLKSV